MSRIMGRSFACRVRSAQFANRVTPNLQYEASAMKRVLVLLLVLLPVCWFGVGCQKGTVPGASGKAQTAKEEKEKLDKGYAEKMQEMMTKGPTRQKK
jgi:hypothetical protein